MQVDESSNAVSSLSYALLDYEYQTPGVYDLSITIQGFPNITNYHGNNLLDEVWQIKVVRQDWIQLTIAPDGTCVDTTHSGATMTTGFVQAFYVASVVSLIGLLL